MDHAARRLDRTRRLGGTAMNHDIPTLASRSPDTLPDMVQADPWRLDQFVSSLTSAAPTTIRAYRSDLDALVEWTVATRCRTAGATSIASSCVATCRICIHAATRAARSRARRRRFGVTSIGCVAPASSKRHRRRTSPHPRAVVACRESCGPTRSAHCSTTRRACRGRPADRASRHRSARAALRQWPACGRAVRPRCRRPRSGRAPPFGSGARAASSGAFR